MSDDPVLTVEEAADELRVSQATIRRAIQSGRLVAFKPGEGESKYGGAWRIRESALRAYEEACTPAFDERQLPAPVARPRRSRVTPSRRGSLRALAASDGGGR